MPLGALVKKELLKSSYAEVINLLLEPSSRQQT